MVVVTAHQTDEGSLPASPARGPGAVAVVLSVVKTRWGLRPHAPPGGREACATVCAMRVLARREARRRTARMCSDMHVQTHEKRTAQRGADLRRKEVLRGKLGSVDGLPFGLPHRRLRFLRKNVASRTSGSRRTRLLSSFLAVGGAPGFLF
jgi:hypothetical protein